MISDTCRLCGHAMKGVAHVTPEGNEYNQMECVGPLRHILPYEPNMRDVLAFRARVSQLMEVPC